MGTSRRQEWGIVSTRLIYALGAGWGHPAYTGVRASL